MDFELSSRARAEHARLRALGETVAALPADERLPALAAAGVLGLSLPVDHGGGGLDLVATAHALAGLGETLSDGGVLLAAGAHLFGVGMTVARIGSEAQKTRWLPAMATGACVATVAATEAAAGSDVGQVEATVGAEGDRLRARGDKRYVTYADGAGVFLFVGRDPAAKRQALTVALVPAGDGVQVGGRWKTAGLDGARLAPVSFDCQLDGDAVLGRAGGGMAVFQTAMAYERALVLAFRLGAMQRQLDEARRFARRRQVGGTAIAQHQAVSHRIARMYARLEAARLLTYRAAWALEKQPRAHLEAALAKWQLADAAVASALDAFRLRGGSGYLEDDAEGGELPTLVDALGGSIHSGTPDVLANIVAAWLL